jgi:hypothetical protein
MVRLSLFQSTEQDRTDSYWVLEEVLGELSMARE